VHKKGISVWWDAYAAATFPCARKSAKQDDSLEIQDKWLEAQGLTCPAQKPHLQQRSASPLGGLGSGIQIQWAGH